MKIHPKQEAAAHFIWLAASVLFWPPLIAACWAFLPFLLAFSGSVACSLGLYLTTYPAIYFLCSSSRGVRGDGAVYLRPAINPDAGRFVGTGVTTDLGEGELKLLPLRGSNKPSTKEKEALREAGFTVIDLPSDRQNPDVA
tara:strand:+ start:1070 stop:1492 length:423 start_codon:yes stop_codon:yes gene_type:complete